MADWASTSQKNGSVSFTACSFGGKPIVLKAENARIVFEPSVYGGDGSELRKNICFTNVPDDIMANVQAMEGSLESPCSCAKEDLLKAKVSFDKVRIFDASRNRTGPPETWRGWEVNAMIRVRGKWETRTQCGLCLELTDIQLLREANEATCPF
jgi:hypothetical protein